MANELSGKRVAVLASSALERRASSIVRFSNGPWEMTIVRFSNGPWEMTMPNKQDHRWSAQVTEHSDALDLEPSIFKSDDPHRIAMSLKHSAEVSRRRKSSPLRSAMSMLTFYLNRAGKNLSAGRRKTLAAAKDELRRAFGRDKK